MFWVLRVWREHFLVATDDYVDGSSSYTCDFHWRGFVRCDRMSPIFLVGAEDVGLWPCRLKVRVMSFCFVLLTLSVPLLLVQANIYFDASFVCSLSEKCYIFWLDCHASLNIRCDRKSCHIAASVTVSVSKVQKLSEKKRRVIYYTSLHICIKYVKTSSFVKTC